MKYVIDIDGTLCSHEYNYSDAKPYIDNIQHINRLYKDGHIIWLFTARGTDTKIDWTSVTIGQLKKWGVSYHNLLFGKPSADRYIDDKAINAAHFPW